MAMDIYIYIYIYIYIFSFLKGHRAGVKCEVTEYTHSWVRWGGVLNCLLTSGPRAFTVAVGPSL